MSGSLLADSRLLRIDNGGPLFPVTRRQRKTLTRADKHQRGSPTRGQDGLYRHKSVQSGCSSEVYSDYRTIIPHIRRHARRARTVSAGTGAYHRPENAPLVLVGG